MFNKFSVFYCFIVILSSAIKFNKAADSTKSDKLLEENRFLVAEAKDVWQPMIPSRYWLSKSTTLNPNTGQRGISNSKNILSKTVKEKRNSTLRNAGNYGKRLAKPAKTTVNLTAQALLPSTSVESFTKLETKFDPLDKRISQITNKASEEYQMDSYPHPHIQTSRNGMHREQNYQQIPLLKHKSVNESSALLSRLSGYNYKHSTGMAKLRELTNQSTSSLTEWHKMTQANPVAAVQQTDATSNYNATEFPLKVADNNKKLIEMALATTSESFLTKENLKPQHQQTHFHNSKTVNDTNSLKLSETETTASAVVNGSHESKEKFWQNLLNKSVEFYNRIKPKMPTKDYEIDDGKQTQSNVMLNEADDTYNDIDLEALTTTAQQWLESASTTLSAAIAASLKKLEDSFDMAKIFSATSTAATSFWTFFHSANETKTSNSSVELKLPSSGAEIMPQIRHLPSKYEIASTAATPTSQSSASVSSGRKLKKVKKKFQEILLPLLLAYKLKFVALIPLLAGGLILLVGSTGLAGFFFALFTAVMSLHSSHGSAIVVKKY